MSDSSFPGSRRIVERSNLAALEFLMSKQPRGNVRMTGGGNTGGVRVSNIFAEVNKFQSRFEEMKAKASKREAKVIHCSSIYETDRNTKSMLYVSDFVSAI